MKFTDKQRLRSLREGYHRAFGGVPERYFSAPGRTELCGNHTDHQGGRVLAAAIDLDAVAAAAPNGTDEILVKSLGYPICRVSLAQLEPEPSEAGTTQALVRGMAAGLRSLGHPLGGFNAYVESQVLPGSGLSSSAAFEVLMGTVMNHLFCGGDVSLQTVAILAQRAENDFFLKPCGLMDQMASAVGNLVAIDFSNSEKPRVAPLDYDFSAAGHALCILDSGASHADLTDEYAAIPRECGAVAAALGSRVLSQVPEEVFYRHLPSLRASCGDRAVLRAVHFYQEQSRVSGAVDALNARDFPKFLSLLRASGRSSWMYLQNVAPAGAVREQAMAVTLALCDRLLGETGAFRVHGGGFAGTAQALVPLDRLEPFRDGVEAVLGRGACHVLHIRPQGGAELEVEA